MLTRSNWLLRCSILINIAITLYIGSHISISGINKAEDRAKLSQKEPFTIAISERNSHIGDPALTIGNISEVKSCVNNTNTKADVVMSDEEVFEELLRSKLNCYDRNYNPEILQRGDFWILKNYIRADHGEIKCHSSITYTTHADYTFLDNVIPLLERWNAPLSIALHAPGTDFQPTLDAIKYLRDCMPKSYLVRMFTTFHIYFSNKHNPKNIPKYYDALKPGYNCTLPPSYTNISVGQLYKTQNKLLYPINVGRNIARDAALTHFILPSDIELYPNPGLVKQFLEMIARSGTYLNHKAPRVFPLSIFEVKKNTPVPRNKTELQMYFRKKEVKRFHQNICFWCHGLPKAKEWMKANETDELNVFHINKRLGGFKNWEPIFIGTHADPHYDERLSWEGQRDKMTQGYALCVLNYEFHILDNAFLVHKPGIKVFVSNYHSKELTRVTNFLIDKIVSSELKYIYGTHIGCAA